MVVGSGKDLEELGDDIQCILQLDQLNSPSVALLGSHQITKYLEALRRPHNATEALPETEVQIMLTHWQGMEKTTIVMHLTQEDDITG